MCDSKLESTESFSEGEGVFHEEIISLSLELGMFFLLKDKDNISSDTIRLDSDKKQVGSWVKSPQLG